jgi:hypothetical protein
VRDSDFLSIVCGTASITRLAELITARVTRGNDSRVINSKPNSSQSGRFLRSLACLRRNARRIAKCGTMNSSFSSIDSLEGNWKISARRRRQSRDSGGRSRTSSEMRWVKLKSRVYKVEGIRSFGGDQSLNGTGNVKAVS